MTETNPKQNDPSQKQAKLKKNLGVFFIVVGFIALVTPFTPGAWLIPIGLGLIGVRLAFWEKIRAKFFPDKKEPQNGDDKVKRY
jgi:hypothetical protein